MNRLLLILLFLGLSFGITHAAAAQATQDVTINVSQIEVLGANGGAVTFDFTNSDVTPGVSPATISKSRSYDLFTNITGAGVKITGQLGADYASGITLKANLSAPADGGSSQGAQPLSASSTVDLVTSIPPTVEQDVKIDYAAEITPDAEPSSGATRTVTYTITAQ